MIYYIFFSALIFYLINKVFNIRNLFNPFVFVMIFHFVFFYLGLFYKDIYTHIEIKDLTVFLVNYSFISVFLGGIVSRYLMQQNKVVYIRFPRIDYLLNINDKITLIGFVFILLGFLCTLKYIISAGGIVILMQDVENARIETRKGQGLIVQLALNFFTYGLLTILMVKSTKFFKFLFVIIVFLFVLSFGNRGPALFLLVFTLYVIQAVSKIEFSTKKIALYGISLFSLMVLFGSLRTNYEADLSALFKARFAWRPFVNIQNFQLVLDYFPEKHKFLFGKTYYQDFSMLLPGSHPNSGTYLKDLMGLKFDGGSITPSYLGMSYVNFGITGLIFSPFLLGFISNTVYEFYVNRINLNYPPHLIFLILLSFNFAAIVSSGLMTVIIQNMTIIILIHLIYEVGIRILKKVK